jgi:hypothetical protein
LLASADLVLIRPGFNLSREAYEHARRCIVFATRQHAEATVEHLAFMSQRHATRIVTLEEEVALAGICDVLGDEPRAPATLPWVEATDRMTELVASKHSKDHPYIAGFVAACRLKRRDVFVRIDDVIGRSPGLIWLLERLAHHQLAASLEVVPLLASFDEEFLLEHDPTARRLEVSQHGFAHTHLRGTLEDTKAEFSTGAVASTEDSIRLARGRELLVRRFPTYFKEGFSAPYDAWPQWLATTWGLLGGRFVNAIWANPRALSVPLVRSGVETWDWGAQRLRSAASIVGDVIKAWQRRSYAGVVIHPQHFASGENRAGLDRTLSWLARAASLSVLPSHLAKPQRAGLQTASTRSYLEDEE